MSIYLTLSLISIFFIFFGYSSGSVLYASVISKYLFKKNIRKIGSYNPGATNINRNFGISFAALVFILDTSKVYIPTFISLVLFKFLIFNAINSDVNYAWIVYLAGFSAIIGHLFPFL
jgi:glycerol-3-phosphate acyltransferase PlsY